MLYFQLIFLTTLFYLLSASGSNYLPVDFIISLTPQPGEASPTVLSFYVSVEAAIASVLLITLKKTIFYGMYTVLTHSLFGLDIVVLPSSKLSFVSSSSSSSRFSYDQKLPQNSYACLIIYRYLSGR